MDRSLKEGSKEEHVRRVKGLTFRVFVPWRGRRIAFWLSGDLMTFNAGKILHGTPEVHNLELLTGLISLCLEQGASLSWLRTGLESLSRQFVPHEEDDDLAALFAAIKGFQELIEEHAEG